MSVKYHSHHHRSKSPPTLRTNGMNSRQKREPRTETKEGRRDERGKKGEKRTEGQKGQKRTKKAKAKTYPEPITPLLKPEPHHIVHRAPHVRVLPVQVGLAGDVEVEVVFFGVFVPLPCRAWGWDGEGVIRVVECGRDGGGGDARR